MTHRGVPPIHASDLRDHSDDERVGRIWDRIESDLNVAGPVRAPSRRWGLLAAAALVLAFGGGLGSGKLLWADRTLNETPSVVRASDEQFALDVLAAGTQGRTFPLPGGGQITLAPGATVEIVRNPDSSMSLRLVHGEASVDTSQGRQPLAILAGDAMLSMPTGSALHVRRSMDDTMDVSVSDGTVHIVSPQESKSLTRGERVERFPIRTVTSLAPVSVSRQSPLLVQPQSERVSTEPAKVAAATPDWHTHNNAGNSAEAVRLLRSQPDGIRGAIRGARSAQELMDIHDVVMSNGEPAEKSFALEALQRIVEAFPDSEYAQIAAFKLGALFQASNPAESRKWFERAQGLKGPLTEDASCRRFKAARGEEAVRLAKEYLSAYPQGRCKEEAERVAAGDEGTSEEEEQTTSDAGADGGK